MNVVGAGDHWIVMNHEGGYAFHWLIRRFLMASIVVASSPEVFPPFGREFASARFCCFVIVYFL